MRTTHILMALMLALLPATLSAHPNKTSSAQRLHALFDEDWEYQRRYYPFLDTFYGDHRYDDRLPENTPEAIADSERHTRKMLEKLKGIPAAGLKRQDRISRDLFEWQMRTNLDGFAFHTEYMPLDQMGGIHTLMSGMVPSLPFATTKDYRNYLGRLSALPRAVDQAMAFMRLGMTKGYTPPRDSIQKALLQIEHNLVEDPAKDPLFAPFLTFPEIIPESERPALVAQARSNLADQVQPTWRRLRDFVRDTYLPACTTEVSVDKRPWGKAYYDYLVRLYTTTDLKPEEIHHLGLQEMARIHKEMEQIKEQVGFKGTLKEFIQFIRTDARFYVKTPEELLRLWRDATKRIDAKLPELFAELPRVRCGVMAMPDGVAEGGPAAEFGGVPEDGSKAGFIWVNTTHLDIRPTYGIESCALHEGEPGHHTQSARSNEQLRDLPKFRTMISAVSYIEGWALYCEGLGKDLGLYQDPYSLFGRLSSEAMRAGRLVVDTGMNRFGWSRQQTIDYLRENTASADIEDEVDRYTVWPGQALAYKIGELKILELRELAKKELGEKFDIRKFHNLILDDGAMPLSMLEQRVRNWIAEQKSSERSYHQ